jgi:hypothetical protein
LRYTDITETALESGYLISRDSTPHNTMRARLSVDVRDNPKSPFVQTALGVYGLQGRAPYCSAGTRTKMLYIDGTSAICKRK